ncbi:hypothetical protein [Symmachiella dynata]|uniref:hypothetical protein n=1 Tax=Symmachiella dynata TaxID=2527995 RepID=UPI0011A9B565|nr:hypothetical protein [Symmachiella dynata]
MKMKFKLNLHKIIRKPWAAAIAVLGVCLIHYLTATTVLETTVNVKPHDQPVDPKSMSEIPEAVFDHAFAALDAQRTKAGKPLLDLNAVAQQLSVSFDEENQTLQLRCLSQDAGEAESILNALADGYVENSRKLKSSVALPRIEQLKQDNQETQQQLQTSKTTIAATKHQMDEESLSETAQLASMERIKSFSAQIVEAKADRLDAENRYHEASQELETGSAVNLVAAQLSTGSAKEIVQAVMSHADLVDELQQLRQTEREYSQYYGARHPRMIEIQSKQAELLRQIDDLSETGSGIQQISTIDQPDQNDRRALLLKTLAMDLRQKQTREDDLQDQWDLEQARIIRHSELQDRLQQAQLETEAAEKKLESIKAEIATTTAGHQAHAMILAPAATATEPVSPSFWGHLLWGCLAAVAVGLLSRWAFKDLKQGTASSSTPLSSTTETAETSTQPPLYARRLMRLAKLNRNQEATS